jgi:uncharacterized membrane-anchored protein YhcB (DUF1043 family)
MSPSEYEQLVLFLGERFETIDRRFETIDRRFDTIDQRFEIVGQRFETMDRHFDTIDRRFDELRAELLGHFDEIYRRLERLEQEYHAISQALRRIEAMLADERVRRDILERDLTTLRENVALLNARIEDIDRRLRSGS